MRKLAVSVLCSLAPTMTAVAQNGPGLVFTPIANACAFLSSAIEALPIEGNAANRIVADLIEDLGPRNWYPGLDEPDIHCSLTSFRTGSGKAYATYMGFREGPQKLLYRVIIPDADQPREFLVLHSGTLNYISGNHLAFSFAEVTPNGVDIYAILDWAPTPVQVHKWTEDILAGHAQPTIRAQWSEDADIPVLTILD